MVFPAAVKGYGKPMSLLIDSGATASFVSRKALQQELGAYERLDKRRTRDRMTARLADGNLIEIESHQVRLRLQFLDFDFDEWLYVIDMSYRYEIILGMSWLREHEPWTDWKSGLIGSTRAVKDPRASYREEHHLYQAELGVPEDAAQPVSAVWRELALPSTTPCGEVANSLADGDSSSHSGAATGLSLEDSAHLELSRVGRGQAPDEVAPREPCGDATTPNPCGRTSTPLPSCRIATTPRRERQAPRQDSWNKVHSVEFEVEAINDLPTTASELLALEEQPFRDFLQELKSGTVSDVAVITPDIQHELSAVDSSDSGSPPEATKKERFNAQSWEALKDNPAYSVISEFRDVLSGVVPSRLPADKGIRHEIDLVPGTKYCVTRQWPLPREQVEVIDAHFAKHLASGNVRESKSPHCAPTFCVKKATGGWRIVHAYNKLNAATIPAQTPIPRRDSVIDNMSGCTRFSTIDLTDGYYQLLMRESDIPYTAVSTPSGMLWEWLVMPQGLKNAPATFNRLVTHLFRPMRAFVQTYFDDIFVHSRASGGLSDVAVHNEHLRKVLQCMRENHLYANLRKCVFSAVEIPCLGCFVGKEGVRADPEKVKAVADWPQPRSVADLRKWLGLANYLHRFSQNYAELAQPLTNLLRKDVPFEWTSAHTDAFEAVKRSLIEAPVLALPDFDTPFWVVCDASDYAIGCALLQHDADGVERVVGYHSRGLKAAERNYPVHDKELLAMKYALVKFRVYLLGSEPFVVYTDHASLRTATQSPHLSQRMARWLSFFAEYNFSVAYKPGRENILADALSRRPDLDPKALDAIMGIDVVGSSLHDEIRAAYDDDDVCRSLITHFCADPDKVHPLPDAVRASVQRYSYRDQLLWYQVSPTDAPRIVVPANDEVRSRILYEYHDAPTSGHVGREKTYVAVAAQFYWRRMYKYVERYVRGCATCQSVKPAPSSAAPLRSLPVPNECWADVSLDFIFGLPKDKYRNTGILVFVCRLSKQVRLAACSTSVDAKRSARLFLDHVFRNHGMPKRLVSDRDPRFTGAFWTEIFRLLGTQLSFSTARHPETDGQTERVNRIVEDMLRCYCQRFPKEWSSLLSLVEFAINNSEHASTGFTPFFVNNLRHPRVPAQLSSPDGATISPDSEGSPDVTPSLVESVKGFLRTRAAVLSLIRDQMAASQDSQKLAADRFGRSNRTVFQPGDRVWLNVRALTDQALNRYLTHAHIKLRPRFIGPFTVRRAINARAYRLALPPTLGRVHPTFYVGMLKRATATSLEGGMDPDHLPSDPPPSARYAAPPPHESAQAPPRSPPRSTPASAPQGGQLRGDLPPALPRAAEQLRTPSEVPSSSASTGDDRHRPVPACRRAQVAPPSGDHQQHSPLRCDDPPPALPSGQPQQRPVHASTRHVHFAPLPPRHGSPSRSLVQRGARAAGRSPRASDRVPGAALPVQSASDRHVPAVAGAATPPSRSESARAPQLAPAVVPSVASHFPNSSGSTRRSPQERSHLDTPLVPARGDGGDATTRTSAVADRPPPPEPARDYGALPHGGRAARSRSASTRRTDNGAPEESSRPPRQLHSHTATQYTVDRLVARRSRRGQVQYLVHWHGYPASARTWEPAKHLLEDCPSEVLRFEGERTSVSHRQ